MCTQDKEEVAMSIEEAVRLIQIHERARQGRLRYEIMKKIRKGDHRPFPPFPPKLDPDVAATCVQKVCC